MTTSTTIKEIALALSLAQSEMKPAEMNATNPFLKNRYADLGAIMKVAREPLAKYGLSFTQLVGGSDGNVSLETILMHKSGEWISTAMIVSVGTEKGRSQAQEIGAMITYLKRYSLASILGIFSEEDTDGASKKETKKEQAPASGNGKKPTTAPMTIEEAVKIKNRDGVEYGTITTEKLSYMINELNKLPKRTPEQEDKMLAIQLIMADRNKEAQS